ncbi:DgyrCDS5078 [Dimorphilus gyrociliatus]|uniref:DgyrCDS5078 n=1 Tax=Dimorphilus gyrociliatus TaxID=2664684 RepID=A0A7I8VNJ4_9ANNE|nr:DgyrCDS5078 [Dimorphilus gyrociliatus]
MTSKYNSKDRPAIFYRQVVINLFNFSLASSKFCLLPFLTLYLKFLGLEPLHVGLIFAVYSFLPIIGKWTCSKCATSCGFRRAALMLSLFFTILGYVVIMFIPPKTSAYDKNFLCIPKNDSDKQFPPSVPSTTTEFVTKFNLVTERKTELPTEFRELTKAITEKITTRNVVSNSPISSFDLLSERDKNLLASRTDVNKLRLLTREQLTMVLAKIKEKSRRVSRSPTTPATDFLSRTLNKMTSGVHSVADKLKNVENKTLLFVLLTISGISLFGSAVEPVADDIWHDFLDRFDRLDKYGSHSTWYDFGTIWTPVTIAAAVEFGNCERIMHLPTVYLFFLSFACLMGFCLILSIFFPNKTAHRKRKFLFGLRTTFGDVRSIFLTITAMACGFATSTVEIFLFWKMFKDGNWLSLGIVVSASRVGQVVSSTIVGRALKNLIFFETCLGLFFISAGLVWCSLVEKAGGLWLTPACVGVMGFGKGFILSARHWHPEFRINSIIVNRRAQSVVNHFENHIGFGIGALISGPIYSKWGVEVLMQIGAILLGLFLIANILVAKCSPPRPTVKYSKLLPDVELDDDEEDSDKEEDDWLEHALIRDKMGTKIIK